MTAPVAEPSAGAEGAPVERRGGLPRGWRAAVLGGVAIVYLVMGLAQARSDSLAVDEAPDVAGGLTAWVDRSAWVTPEHGLLPRVVFGALPVLLADPIVPDGPASRSGDWFAATEDIVRANDRAGRLDDVVFWARVPTLLVGLATALAIHALARRWAGPTASLVAAVAWLTTPLVVGIHHLASIDPATALAVVGLVLATVRLLEAPSDRRVVVAGLALGALLLTRHSGVALVPVPMAVAAVTAATTRDRVRRVLLVGLVAMVAVWGLYRVVDPTGPSGQVRASEEGLVAAAGDVSSIARLVGAAPLPLEWRAGFAHLELSGGAKVSSALGQTWEGGRWWYYPVSVAVASPPLTLVLLGLAPLAFVGWRTADERRRRSLAVAGAAAVLVLLPLLAQDLQLGPRLMLPVLALALALGAAGGEALAARAHRAAAPPLTRPAVAGLLVVVQLTMLAGSAPSSFGWTPPWFRPGYRWAGTQATDLGQDRDRLADWAADHQGAAVAVLTPRGQERPAGTRDLRRVEPDDLTGWVAVSVSTLVTFGPDLAWLRGYCAVDTVGRSILVYRFATPPDRTPGPGLPVAACVGAEESTRR